MTRRTLVLLTAIVALVAAAPVSANPARASYLRVVDPTQIDPNSLKLPDASLPTGAQSVHSAVSNNDDAQGITTPVDGDRSVFGIAHGAGVSYASEGRLTGYRMDVHYQVNGTAVRTGYLASIYPSPEKAQAAYNDVTGPLAVVNIIGGKPLPDACTAGEQCIAESFVSPIDPTREAVTAVFVRGPILIETASDTPATQFSSIESPWVAAIYNVLHAADQQIQAVLSGNPPPPPNTTSTPTSTTQPSTDTPTPTSIPAMATPTSTPQPLFVRVSIEHRSIKAGKKQSIRVTTLPGATVTILVKFPSGKKLHHARTVSDTGRLVWRFKQPRNQTRGKNHTARVSVRVSLGGETHKANKKYKIH